MTWEDLTVAGAFVAGVALGIAATVKLVQHLTVYLASRREHPRDD